MWFVALGVILLLLKVLAIGPVAEWSWLWVLAPFAGAVAWWAFADSTGLTQKKAMQRMEERKEARRQKAMEALGQGDERRRR